MGPEGVAAVKILRGLVIVLAAFAVGFVATIYGMEVGCLMNLAQAAYLKSGGANWQLAFGIFNVDGSHVSPHLVYMRNDGSFVWDRKVWQP